MADDRDQPLTIRIDTDQPRHLAGLLVNSPDIVGIEFEVDGDISMAETGVTLARIRSKGIAIKLSPTSLYQ